MWRKVMMEKASRNEIEVMTAVELMPSQEKNGLQHLGEKRFPHPAEPEARESDPELAGREISIEIARHLLGLGGAHVTFVGQRFELAHADFYQRKFRCDKKAVEEHEGGDRRQLRERESGRVPMFRDALGECREGQK